MATYAPPSNIEDLTIFNPAYFESADQTLTQSEADKRYLKYPNAQGTENLQAINVNGVAGFNNNIVVGSAGTSNLTPQITTYKSQLNLGSGGSGELNIECPVDIGGFGSLNLTTANINLGSNSNILQTSGTQNTLNKTTITTANGVSATPALDIVDSVSGNTLHFIPQSGAGSYNPSSDSGNQVIVASGIKNAEVLELTTWSDTNASVKITNNSVSMGAGSISNVPTASVVCNGVSNIVEMTSTSVKNVIDIQDTTNPSTQHTSLTTLGNSFSMLTYGTTPSVAFAVNSANYLQYNSSVGGLILTGTDLNFNTTNPPTCNVSSTISLSDDSNKLPSTAWVRDYVATTIPVAPTTFVSTASTTGYNSGGNYTYWYFTSYPTWSAYSWVFNTPTTSRSNVNKSGLGSSPPLNVGTIGANGSFLFMTGNGISQGYTASSSNMITYCNGYQQNYSISAGATASILSIINCIGGTPASPFFQSNQLAENNGTCPPSAFGLSGYIVLQMLNGNYTGLGTPTLTFTQIIP